MTEPPPNFKVVLVGDSSVGKTAIFQRLQNQPFYGDQSSTIGASCITIKIAASPKIPNTQKTVTIWDTAGQERFRTIVPIYFQHASVIIVTYDITSRDSFDHVHSWIDLSKENTPNACKFIIVGNKADLATEWRAVTFAECGSLREEVGALTSIEVSAKTGWGIDNLLGVISSHCDDILLESNHTKSVSTPIDQQPKGNCGC